MKVWDMVRRDLGKPPFRNSMVTGMTVIMNIQTPVKNKHLYLSVTPSADRSGDDHAEAQTCRPGHGTIGRSVEQLGRTAADMRSEEQPSPRLISILFPFTLLSAVSSTHRLIAWADRIINGRVITILKERSLSLLSLSLSLSPPHNSVKRDFYSKLSF